MSLSIGIVGLPNVGKSTLFNALTDNNILAANYPFATIEPNTGIVPVPDARLGKLTEMYQSKKVIPATVTFTDIAGLVKGANKGEGLGNKFLANIRECDAICHIVRAFENDDIQHVANRIHPADDIEVINTELILADLETVEKVLPRIQKEAKADAKLRPQVELLQEIETALEAGTPLQSATHITEHAAWEDLQKQLPLLTAKPIIYVFNDDEETLADDIAKQKLGNLVAPSKAIYIAASLEDQLRGLDETEREELLAAYGQTEPGLHQLIRAAYDTLGLQSFLTAGEKEVRAWTFHRGWKAPQCAGVIHTDFEKLFIRAEIVAYEELTAAGSMAAAKTAGKVRVEGKDYQMKDGDVCNFRIGG